MISNSAQVLHIYGSFTSASPTPHREDAGELMECEIQAIKNSKVLEARLDNKRDAYVTVRFVASQITVTRNSDGDIIDGHENKASEMVDVWTFTRDVKSKDPRWFVVETRSDDPDDNDIIPDTD